MLGSVASDGWIEKLTRACQLLGARRHRVAGVCLHPYGQRADGFPNDWGFGELREAVRFAHDISGLPVWLTEFGIKLEDAGGLPGQARYLQMAFAALHALEPGIVAVACYFCWRDDIGAPHERGDKAFGLRDLDGRPRTSWYALAESAQGTGDAGPDRPTGAEGEEAGEEAVRSSALTYTCLTGRDVFASGNLPERIAHFKPDSPRRSAWYLAGSFIQRQDLPVPALDMEAPRPGNCCRHLAEGVSRSAPSRQRR